MVLLCIVLTRISTLCRADDLVLSGRMTYHAFKANGEDFFLTTNQFTCRIAASDEQRWNLRVSGVPGGRSGFAKARLYYEVGTGGGNLFSLLRTREEVFRSALAKNPKGRIVGGNAMIINASVPFCDHGAYPTPIWFAFASSYYLHTNLGTLLNPIWPIPEELHERGDYFLRSDIHLNSNEPHLPEHVVFYSSGSYPKSDAGGRLLGISRYKKPFDQEFTNAVFMADSFTNSGGISFPQRFTLTQYRPKPDGRSIDDLVVCAQWTGYLISFSTEVSIEDYRPELRDEITTVVDYRVSDTRLKPLTYAITNQTWLACDSPTFKGMIRTKAANEANKKPPLVNSHQARIVTRALMVGTIVISLCVTIYVSKRSKHKA